MATIDEEIAELRERSRKMREELEKADTDREKREELARLRLEVQRQENAARDAPHIEKAEAEHGPIGRHIAVIDTDLGAIVVKRPPHLLYKRFIDKDKRTSDDVWKLVKPCLVYPDAARVDQMIEELPATLYRIADALLDLAGLRASEVSGK